MGKNININIVKRELSNDEKKWLEQIKPAQAKGRVKENITITLDLILYDAYTNAKKSRHYHNNVNIRLPDIFCQSNFILYASYEDDNGYQNIIELKKHDLLENVPASLYDVKHILINTPSYTTEFKKLLVDIDPRNVNFFKKK